MEGSTARVSGWPGDAANYADLASCAAPPAYAGGTDSFRQTKVCCPSIDKLKSVVRYYFSHKFSKQPHEDQDNSIDAPSRLTRTLADCLGQGHHGSGHSPSRLARDTLHRREE